MYSLKFLNRNQYDQWNTFVESSPQGTIFSTTTWLDAVNCNYKVLSCYFGEELVGGIAFAERKWGPFKYIYIPKLTRYNGIIIKDCSKLNSVHRLTLEYEVAGEIAQYLRKHYNAVNISNHINLKDIRPFIQNRFDTTVNYTFVVDLTKIQDTWSRIKNSVRRQIRSAQKELRVEIEYHTRNLFQMYKETYERQKLQVSIGAGELERIYNALAGKDRAQIYSVKDIDGNIHSSSLVVWDTKSAYYLVGGASNSFRDSNAYSLMLWRVMEDMSQRVPKIDLVGANIPVISDYKKKFGGSLECCFEVDNAWLFKRLVSCKNLLKRIGL